MEREPQTQMPLHRRRFARVARWLSHRRNRALAGTLLLALSGARGASASTPAASASPEEMFIFSDSDVVTSASLVPERAPTAPASVTVIKGEEIRRFGYRTIADLLRNVAGMFTVNDRNYEYLGGRGLLRAGDYNNRVLVLIDGHPLNDDWIGASAIGTDLPVNLLELDRVEIVRGPGSALYGTNAVYAVVNMVTAKAAVRAGVVTHRVVAGGAHAAVAAEGGSWDSADLHAEVEAEPASGHLLVTGSIASNMGEPVISFPPAESQPDGFEARHLDSDRWRDVALSFERGSLQVDGRAGTRHKTIPTASFGTIAGDRRENTDDGRAFVRGRWRTQVLQSNVELSLSEDAFSYDGMYPYDDEEGPLWTESAHGTWTTAGLIARRQLPAQQQLTVGGEHQWHQIRSELATESNGGETLWRFKPPDDRFRVWGLFAQDVVPLGRGLGVTAGGRYDHSQDFGGEFTYRGALTWTARQGTVVKGIFGRAFRAPSRYELYYTDDGETQLPNPNLEPEHVRTLELAVEQDVRGAGHLRLSAFRNELYHLVNLVMLEDGLLQYQNGGRALSRGLELEARWIVPSGLIAHANLSLHDVTDQDGHQLTNTPRIVGSIGASLPLAGQTLVPGILVRGVGRRPTLAGERAASYATTDLSLLCRKGALPLEVLFRVENVLDTHYYDPGSPEHPTDLIPQPGRFVSVQVLFSR